MRMRVSILIVVLFCVAAASLSWLMGTTQGARWMFDIVSRAVPAKIAIGRVDGRLWKRLDLQQIKIDWTTGTLGIERLRLKWSPWMMMTGTIAIDELYATNVTITERGDREKPFAFEWPTAPKSLSWLRGSVKKVHVDVISVGNGNDPPYRITNVDARVAWLYGVLRASRLQGLLPEGGVKGSMEAGFTRPRLSVDMLFIPVKGTHAFEKAVLKITPARKGGKGIDGNLDCTLHFNAARSLHASGRLTLLGSRLALSHVALRDTGIAGVANIEGHAELAEPYNARVSCTLEGLDASKHLKFFNAVSGKIVVEGNPSDFSGQFEMFNGKSGPERVYLQGALKGSLEQIRLDIARANLMDGAATGHVIVKRHALPMITAALSLQKVNPGIVAKNWPGSVNAEMKAEVDLAGERSAGIAVKALFTHSVIRKKPFKGVIDGSWRGGKIEIAQLMLDGDGFNISAHGSLGERLHYSVSLRDFGLFVPDAGGAARVSGWGRWKNGDVTGTLQGSGRALFYKEFKLAAAHADVTIEGNGSVGAKITIDNPHYGSVRMKSLSTVLRGTRSEHSLTVDAGWPGGKSELNLAGTFKDGEWKGSILAFSGRDRVYGGWNMPHPSDLSISKKSLMLRTFNVFGTDDERLDMNILLDDRQREGFVNIGWNRINLKRFTPLLSGSGQLSGRASGSVKGKWTNQNIVGVEGTVSIAGALSAKNVSLEVPQTEAAITWDDKGLRGSFESRISPSGRLSGTVSSAEAVRLGLPHTSDLSVRWEGLKAQSVGSFLPDIVDIEGILSGWLKGRLLADMTLDVAGKTSLTNGALSSKTERGIITTKIRTATADITWQGSSLKGKTEVDLADYGRAQCTFQLPLNAQLPISMDKRGHVGLSLSGSVRERGMLSALFPGLVRESHGCVDLNATASGTWEHPGLRGSVRLSGAGAFLPAAGIRLKNVSVDVDFTEHETILISFRADSGPGRVEGKASARLESGTIKGFEGIIRGDNFQAVYLPTLRVQVNPDLQIKGTSQKVVVTGKATIPEASVTGEESRLVKTSSDVHIVDLPAASQKPMPFAVDAAVEIVLGKKVTISSQGVNANLEGKVLLTGTSIDDIRAKGTIEVVKGFYSAYGLRLDIERGRIVFAGGPVESGTLDILALRKISEYRSGEIKPSEIMAGVLVTGPFRNPVVNLYSSPLMADTDILSYMLFGTPLQGNASQTAILFQAAQALLPKGQSASLIDQLQNFLGIDTLGVETRPGQGGTTQSILTVGKYLTPRLYVGMGRALLSDENLITMRLALSRSWELQSQTGSQSGLGIYYKVEFD